MSNLKSIRDSDLKAAPGKFRAVAIIDSDCYQIGKDANSLDEAVALCHGAKEGTPVQVYDDSGTSQINH